MLNVPQTDTKPIIRTNLAQIVGVICTQYCDVYIWLFVKDQSYRGDRLVLCTSAIYLCLASTGGRQSQLRYIVLEKCLR